MVRKTARSLPLSLAPRDFSRVQAAEYIGVGVTKFDEMVDDGRMPRPKRIDGRSGVVPASSSTKRLTCSMMNEGLKNEWDNL